MRPPLERELYEPFAAWVRASWANDASIFSHVRVTGTPANHARNSGTWSRADVMGVQLWDFDWVPGTTVELSSYELKKRGDDLKIESVYEAAAQARWAHRSSLVIEESAASLGPRFVGELKRFGLGLYLVSRRGDGELDVIEQIEPDQLSPEPAQLDEALSYFFESDRNLGRQFRRLI